MASPAGPQEPPKAIPACPGDPKTTKPVPVRRVDSDANRAEIEAILDKMFDAYDLKPHPLPAIPDDPPPHEGAMIGYPIVIEPPDLVLVEVLEALPGRPISGERLVRPDGTINLGFYGDVHVAGLTPIQAKVKIIKHLRKYLTDDTLGLVETTFEKIEKAAEPPARKPASLPSPSCQRTDKTSKRRSRNNPSPSSDPRGVKPLSSKVRSIRQGQRTHRSPAILVRERRSNSWAYGRSRKKRNPKNRGSPSRFPSRREGRSRSRSRSSRRRSRRRKCPKPRKRMKSPSHP